MWWGKLRREKKKGKKKRGGGGGGTYDLRLVTCTCVEGKVIYKKKYEREGRKKKK
jgi:hypothetical protein